MGDKVAPYGLSGLVTGGGGSAPLLDENIARVKRNIAKMIEQSAPESDIDAYVASEGVTPEELRAHKAAQPSPEARNPFMQFDPLKAINPITAGPEWAKAWNDPSAAWRATDDSVRMLAKGATLGYADKIAAKMNQATGLDFGAPVGSEVGNSPLDRERARSAAAKERLGVQGDVLEIAGSMLPATRLAQAGVTATRIPGAVGKYAGGLLDGAAFGAVQAAGNDKDILTGAGLGGFAGLLGPAAGKAVEKVMGAKATKAMQEAAPSLDEVKAKKDALYSALDNAEVKFDADAFERMMQDTSAALKNFRATKAPMTADTVQYMTQFRGTSPTFRDIEDILQEAKGILRERNATQADKKAAGIVVDKLSTFFDSAALSTNGSIPAKQVAAMAREARELSRRTILAREIKDMEDAADGYLGGEESAFRNRFGSLLRSNKRKGLTEEERKAFAKVVRREGLLGLLNQTGSRAGSLVQMGAGLASVPLVGPAGLAVAGAGLLGNVAARKGMEAYTRKSADSALKTVLAGRAAQSAAKPNPDQIEYLNALIRSGLLGVSGSAIANSP